MQAKVAFYSDALTSGRYGLGRYASELLHALARSESEIQVRPVSAHSRLTPEAMAALQKDYGHQQLPFGRRVAAGLWSSLGRPRLERWTPWADVVHCVELDYCVATARPSVVTIHDIGPLTHPEFFSTSHPWLLKRALRAAYASADAIVCVSNATATAVQEWLGCSLGDRLHVVLEGVSDSFFQPVPGTTPNPAAFLKGEPYFLWTGSLNPRKNMTRVVRAFEQVAETIPHHLVLVGGLGWDAGGTLQTVEASRLRNRIHLPGRVSDEELRGYYQHAAGFIYPSLMEGFGLPILEAMASGCPVITSNCSSMPEVAGEAALLADPCDLDALAGAMHRLASDPVLSARLTAQGRTRALTFRWDTCARAMLEIYDFVAQNRAHAATGCRHPSGTTGRRIRVPTNA